MNMNKTTYGTAHFVSHEAAVSYYDAYEDDPARAVETKLREGSIHIGKPELKPGQTLSVIDDGTRYAITEATPYQPKTGQKCGCKPGQQRDNCPTCEGTGWVVDFAAIRARRTN